MNRGLAVGIGLEPVAVKGANEKFTVTSK